MHYITWKIKRGASYTRLAVKVKRAINYNMIISESRLSTYVSLWCFAHDQN